MSALYKSFFSSAVRNETKKEVFATNRMLLLPHIDIQLSTFPFVFFNELLLHMLESKYFDQDDKLQNLAIVFVHKVRLSC